MGGHGELDRDRLPADVLLGQRLLFRVRQGLLHPVGQPLGEHHAVLLVAVVVLARADVPPGAVEVDVQGLGDRLAADEPGDAGEVGAGDAGPVIALRVAGVVAEHRDRPVPVPEREQRHLRVDDALRLGPEGGVLGRGVADRADLAVRPEDAAVGRDLLHLGDAPAVVRGRLCGRDRALDRPGGPLHHVPVEAALEPAEVLQPEVADQPLGREVAPGRVVLVQGVDGDAVGGRAGGVRQPLAEQVVPLVRDADPVDRAQDDRLAGAEDHDAPAAERQLVEPLDRVIRHRRAQRRRRVHVERRDLDGGRRRRLRGLGRPSGGQGGQCEGEKKGPRFHRPPHMGCCC